ncbi:MAG: hypothetical protein OEV43_01355 [Coriobacteriia bacterium]|nr:hypothetical protein [Coriobacteriia bacterium]
MEVPRQTSDTDALAQALMAEERAREDGVTDNGLWRNTLQWTFGLLAVTVMAYFTYARNGWVPLLSGVDLGIHEFGHMILMWGPPVVVWMAGSVLQMLVPAGLAVYFAVRRDMLAVILMCAWAAESLNNVGVYVYDATRLRLDLLGDDGSKMGHDWANILTELKLIPYTDQIAYAVRALSFVLFALAAFYAIRGFVRPRLAAQRDEQLKARKQTLPVHEPRNRPPAV